MGLNICLNLVYVLANLFTLALTMPALNILFETQTVDLKTTGGSGFNAVYAQFYGWLQTLISNDKTYGLLLIGATLIAAALIKNTARYFAMFYMVRMRNYTVRDLRQNIYRKVVMLPLSYFSNERKGDLMSRMSNDMREIEWALMNSLEALFKEPMTIIAYICALIYMSPGLTLYVILILPISAILTGLIGRSLRRKSEKNQRLQGRTLSLLEETLGGIKVIKGFVAEKFFIKTYTNADDEAMRSNISVSHRVDLASPVSETLNFIVAAILLWIGGNLVFKGEMQAQTFIGYFAIFSQIIPPAKALTQAFYSVQRGSASIERVNEVINQPLVVIDPANPKPLTSFNNEIVFENVCFSYDNTEVLKNINLTIKKGQTVALVGHSGAGKSTLADLVARFYDVTSGRILIDGVDVREFAQQDLRSLMGIVTQESILFNDTIFNNISFGKADASHEDAVHASKLANAWEFIEQIPEGLQNNVGDRGNKLSGGQRQRISIARALLKNPDILILDEATSALDTNSEKLVQNALETLMKNRTSLVIAHRLSTIQHSHKIVVLDQGCIAETGTHNELLEAKGIYYSLVQLQELK